MTPQSIDSSLAKKLKNVFGEKILEMTDLHGDLTILIDKKDIHDVCAVLKDHDDFKFEQMMDLTAVDYLKQNKPVRFQVVYHFLSLTYLHRLRIKCDVPENDAVILSITDLWLAADWYERECFDMYGIRFDGHPDLRRILMYDEFAGHPLRKDYPIKKEQPRMELRDVPERYSYMEDFS